MSIYGDEGYKWTVKPEKDADADKKGLLLETCPRIRIPDIQSNLFHKLHPILELYPFRTLILFFRIRIESFQRPRILLPKSARPIRKH